MGVVVDFPEPSAIAARFNDDLGMLTVWFVVDDAVILLFAIVVGVVEACGVTSTLDSDDADCATYTATYTISTTAIATTDPLRLFIARPPEIGKS